MIKIPLVPQWNLNSGCVCTPDGGFLYAGLRSINFISSTANSNENPIIQCFHTRQGILSLDVDPLWGQREMVKTISGSNRSLENIEGGEKVPIKLFAALLQDNSVQIWDFNKGCAIQGHKAHLAYKSYMEGNGPPPQHGEVLLSYMCNRNVLTVDNQDIVVYCVTSNSFYRRPIFISPRNHKLTSLKCSPYNENHFAAGTKRGLVLVCDLQKMSTLYTLRGHNTSISSLSWNRIDVSVDATIGIEKTQRTITPKAMQNGKSKSGKLMRSDATIDSEEIFDIYDFKCLDNEFGVPSQEIKVSNEFISDYADIEKSKESLTTAKFNFVEACQSLKEEIKALREEPLQVLPEHTVSLDDCKRIENNQKDLSSCGGDTDTDDQYENNDVLPEKSSDGSTEHLSYHTPSSEESVDVDGICQNQRQHIICQADIHQTFQSLDDLKSSETVGNHLAQNYDENIVTEASVIGNEKCEEINSTEFKEVYDILLASSSIDGTFCIWNTITGATCDTQRVRSSHGGKNSHIEISWISPTSVIINNKAGELQLWSVQPITSNHTSISTVFRPYKFKENKHNWSQRSVISFACSSERLLWTISSHREVCMEDITLNKIQQSYSCVSTNIGAIKECPDDMNKIALGFSDRRIGVIDISKITPTSVQIENFVHRIESNVVSLVWSPDCKKLAYGTMEGRIGIINMEGANKQPYTYNSSCGKPIYSISWQDKFLYVVCNECIAVYEDDANKKDAYVIPDIDSVACISLRNNHLFVGTQNGQLRLYTRTADIIKFQYELKKSLDLAPRYITEISWSPIVTNKLAIAAKANSIHILEFNSETADLQITRKIEINSQKAAIGCVKWSNRNENYLLTCGFDGAVRIWDLSNETNPEYFLKTYHCPMKCGLFLPTDENIIICSGKSAPLEFIDIRVEKTESSTGKSRRLNPRTLDSVQWATKAVTHSDVKSQTVDKEFNHRLAKIREHNVLEVIKNTTSLGCGDESNVKASEEVSIMLEKLHLENTLGNSFTGSIYMKNSLTLMYLTTKEINKGALDLMFSILSSQEYKENKSLSAKLFGTKSEAKEVLVEELKNHQKSEIKGISTLIMSQLKGNLKDEIIKCTQSKNLCEWHVSLAPSISYSFWQKCCEAYAEQLVEQGYTLQAATYMLAIHQHRGAVEVLMKNKFFKEASLIARIYLQKDDPLNNVISEQWIIHLYTNGNLTGAALLCLLTKQNSRAYKYLTKIRNTAPEIERIIRLLKSSDI